MKRAAIFFVLILTTCVVLRAQEPAMPELSLSANGTQHISVFSGWPLIIHLTIMNSSRLSKNGPPAPVVIAPTGLAWTSAIQFSVTDALGLGQHWPLNLTGTVASPSLTLAPTSYVRATWQMSPADVSALAPGTYQLTAALQVNNSNAWNGVVQSPTVIVQIAPEPALTVQQQSAKALRIAEYQTNAGNINDALLTIQELMQSQPSNTAAMSASANLLELTGYPDLALFQAREAINAYFQANPSFYDPPGNLMAMNQRLFTQALTPFSVSVPKVLGLPQVAATAAITGASLVVGTVTQQSSSVIAQGLVISEAPSAGTTVNSGSVVNLVLSSGPPTVAVPNVDGMTQVAATTAITGDGLMVGSITQQTNSTVSQGSVISESPGAGTIVNLGSAVNLIVSTGPPTVAVPNVVGMTQSAASTAITSAGLRVGSVTQHSSSTVPQGDVISESPAARTTLNIGSAINLVVSSGGAAIVVPNVVGLSREHAMRVILQAGLVVGTITEKFSKEVRQDHVISESPAAGTGFAPGSAVNLVISRGHREHRRWNDDDRDHEGDGR